MDLIIIYCDCASLGRRAAQYAEHIKNVVKKDTNIKVHELYNKTRGEIKQMLSNFNSNYTVAIYAHGDRERKSIYDNIKKADIITLEDAAEDYRGAIVYSIACYGAIGIGKSMYSNGCHIFYGFKDEMRTYINESKEEDKLLKNIFLTADNYGLMLLLDNPNIDIDELCDKIDKKYEDCIQELRECYPDLLPIMMHNKETYIIYGPN